jgi:hypothetical protein
MAAPRDQRLVIGLGALAAVVVGVGAAVFLTRGDEGPKAPPPASEGGLQVDVGETQRASLDPAKPLRCFVKGEFVGVQTLAQCAERNGVAAQALDVGLDETGAVAAAVDQPLQPLPGPIQVAEGGAPPVNIPPVPNLGPVGGSTPAAGGSQAAWGPCMRHGSYGWTTVSQSAPLSVCVNLLFDGRCEPEGGATYGRWGEQTVRLVTGKIEIAPDGKTFSTLVEQGPDCLIPRT